MYYRKKPVVIQAVQFFNDGEQLSRLSDFMNKEIVVSYKEHSSGIQAPRLNISTLEGIMEASEGDWIIKGVNGEFYPCKPDIFEKTYEPVTTE